MKVNSEKIINALNKYFPEEYQDFFEKVIGKPITSFVNVFFNAICFDVDKFENLFKNNAEYLNISLNDWIKREYGEDFYIFFKEKLTARQFNAIALILE